MCSDVNKFNCVCVFVSTMDMELAVPFLLGTLFTVEVKECTLFSSRGFHAEIGGIAKTMEDNHQIIIYEND